MPDSGLKLYYFKSRARGEIPRMVLAAANVDYEFVEVERGEAWQNLKPSIIFGQLPVLEKDGKQYGQSIAIQNFLAREYGLYGSNNLECLEIDQLTQLREDLTAQVSRRMRDMRDKDPKVQAEKEQELYQEVYPRYLGYFTTILKQSNTGYAVGDKLTLADLVLFEATRVLSQRKPDFLQSYPEVAAHREKIANIDGIKEYLDSRETTKL